MAHFYGRMDGHPNREQKTITGHKTTGLRVSAESWDGKIEVVLRHNPETGKDEYTVFYEKKDEPRKRIAHGVIGEDTPA